MENEKGQWMIPDGISAGFPSPAEDFQQTRISLDKELVKNKDATFFARVSGDSMKGAGLNDGDLIVIDKSINPENGKIAVYGDSFVLLIQIISSAFMLSLKYIFI